MDDEFREKVFIVVKPKIGRLKNAPVSKVDLNEAC